MHTDTLQTSMDNFLKKHSTSVFRKPPEDTNSKFLRNTATQITCCTNLDHIMLILHCENLMEKTKWMVQAGRTELQAPH